MSLLTPLLWSFVPSQLATVLVPYACQLLPTLFPPAPRGTPAYARNHRWIYTGLIVGYLAYTFRGADSGDDWYALLGVPRWADDEALKKAYRALSRRYHPDRSSDPAHEDIFIHLRRAYETLSNPASRFAYDRFGPDILTWGLEATGPDSRSADKKEVGIREWMLAGLMRSVGFYVFSGGIMVVLAIIGTAREGSSYRLLLLALLLVAELTLVLAPTAPPYTTALSTIFPSLPPALRLFSRNPIYASVAWTTRGFIASPQFLQIRTLHRLFTSLSIGISQLVGVWSPRQPSAEETLLAATGMARTLEMDAVGEFNREVVPLLQLGDPIQMQARLKHGMRDALVDRSFATHPGVRRPWQAAAQRTMADLRLGAQSSEVEMARRIPLPPSPPPSPSLGPMAL